MASELPFHIEEIKGTVGGPRLLITGGVHGDEFEPMAAVRELARRIKPDKLNGTVTLVPVVNEPAFYRGQRCGEDGLDLARTFPGRADGTITEQIAHALSGMIQQSDFFIDLHTGGTTLRIFPVSGYMLHPEQTVLEQQRCMAEAFNLPVIWGTDHRLNGRSLSVARDAGVPAIYAEYLGSASCEVNGIKAYVDGCLSVMGMLEMMSHESASPACEYWFEDSRPNSGHLQIANPSPFSGFFEPAVNLGHWIKTGDPIGTVCDVGGVRVETVRARESGLVLVLRTFSFVPKNESLAVIVATDSLRERF